MQADVDNLIDSIKEIIRSNKKFRDADIYYYDEYNDGYKTGWDNCLKEVGDEIILAIKSHFTSR